MSDRPSVLIIDDEVEAAALLALHFERDGYRPLVANSGPQGLKLAYEHRPSAVVLDIRMPGMDGYEVCGRLRDFSDAVILFVTVVKDREAIVRGLQLGADDYLIKPFNYLVLLARIEACLRRRNIQRERAQAMRVPFTDWTLDTERREVLIGNRRVQLTPKEFEVLRYFMKRPDTVHAADEILDKLWGPEYVGDPDLVKQFIYRLRLKLEPNPSEPQYFVTIRGSGYAFEPDTRPDLGTVRGARDKTSATRAPAAGPRRLRDLELGAEGPALSVQEEVEPPEGQLRSHDFERERDWEPARLGLQIRMSGESDPVQGWTIFIPRRGAVIRWLALGLTAIAVMASAALCRLALH